MLNHEFYDWSEEATAPLTPEKSKQSATIAQHIEEFLSAGGEIQKVPYDPIPEMVDMATGSLKPNYPTDEGMTSAKPTEGRGDYL